MSTRVDIPFNNVNGILRTETDIAEGLCSLDVEKQRQVKFETPSMEHGKSVSEHWPLAQGHA